jgi:hypothetical protein
MRMKQFVIITMLLALFGLSFAAQVGATSLLTSTPRNSDSVPVGSSQSKLRLITTNPSIWIPAQSCR